jgi:hypothetical protein
MDWQVGPTAISSSSTRVLPTQRLQMAPLVKFAINTWLDEY